MRSQHVHNHLLYFLQVSHPCMFVALPLLLSLYNSITSIWPYWIKQNPTTATMFTGEMMQNKFHE